MMNGPDLVRRFPFGLSMGVDLSSTEADHLFKGIISTATGIPLLQDMDSEEWYENRLHEWTDDSRLQTLLLREGHSDRFQQPIKDVQLHYQTPRFSTCSIKDCNRAGVRGRSCARCWKHLCARHLARKYHSCPTPYEVRHIYSLQISHTNFIQLDDDAWEKVLNDDVLELLSQANSHELVRLATQLNNGISCLFQPGKYDGVDATMGCANHHCWLIFDTGERWIVHILERVSVMYLLVSRVPC